MTSSPSSVPAGAAEGPAEGPASVGALPPEIAKVLDRFGRLGREEKMQSLVAYAKKLEPLPQRLVALDRAEFTVPECQTRVDLFAELEPGGGLHFYADVDAPQRHSLRGLPGLLNGTGLPS